jgi:hypothetical protein
MNALAAFHSGSRKGKRQMLKDMDSAAIVAVKDIARARQFYGETLGLELHRGDDQVLEFETGSTSLVVYVSDFAGTNQANAVVWGVGNEIEQIVADLSAKGVQFEHYEGTTPVISEWSGSRIQTETFCTSTADVKAARGGTLPDCR